MTVCQYLLPIARAFAMLLVTAGLFVASAESLPKEIDENLKTLQSKLGYLNTHTTSFEKRCTKDKNCAQQDQQYMPYYTLQYCVGTSCAYQPITLKADDMALGDLPSHKKAIDNDMKYITLIFGKLNSNTSKCLSSNCHTGAQYIGVYTLVQCATKNVSSCGPTVIPPTPPVEPPTPPVPPVEPPTPPVPPVEPPTPPVPPVEPPTPPVPPVEPPTPPVPPVEPPTPPAPQPPTLDDLLGMIKALNVKTEAFFAACDSKVNRSNGATSESQCDSAGTPCPYCEYTFWRCTVGEGGCRDPLIADTRITSFAGHPASYDFAQSAKDISDAKASVDNALKALNASIANQSPPTTYYVGSHAKLGASASCYYAEHYYAQKPSPKWTFKMSTGQCY